MTEREASLRERLAELYGAFELALWFDTPHPQLGGKSAQQAIDDGQIADVEAIVDRLESGAFL